jgi:hypothetical protein
MREIVNGMASRVNGAYHSIMDLGEFRSALADDAPPEGVSPLLRAMWLAANDPDGDGWHAAHALAQDDPSAEGSWVHAYLHRVEGDLANAGYWYRQAGHPACSAPLTEEWNDIVRALLG